MDYHKHILLAQYTTFRIGGPAVLLAEACSAEEVLTALRRAEADGLPPVVLGGGSNILAADGAIDRLVIVFRDPSPPRRAEGEVVVSGGTALAALVRFANDNGLSGLADLAGIPGTVGGAIAGNAGAYGTAISASLHSLLLTDPTGATRRVPATELEFAYRSSRLRTSGEIVLEATFQLPSDASPNALQQRSEERLAARRRKHPDWHRVSTAGSFFKNPTASNGERIAAGRLLDEAGCKDLTHGAAAVWPSHANIIVARRGATARDVHALSRAMRERVANHCGVELEPEVRSLT